MKTRTKAPRLPQYTALTRLWHTREARHIEAGNTVDLSHLEQGAIDKLIQLGAVAVTMPPAATIEQGDNHVADNRSD
jgi:hypothetical protein